MDDKKLAFAVVIGLLLLTLGAVAFISYEKSTPNYDPAPLKNFLSVADKFIIIINALVALALLFIAFVAYQRTNKSSIMLVGLAFAVIALNWLMRIADKYIIPGNVLIEPLADLFSLVVLGLLFLALFKRK